MCSGRVLVILWICLEIIDIVLNLFIVCVV